MDVGILLPQAGDRATRDAVLRHARAAEEAGFDSLWTNDHVVFPREYRSRYPYSADGNLPGRVHIDASLLEPLTELAFVAGVTSRVQLGVAVLVLNMRQAVLHAKIMATLDHLAGGRLILGAGMGWAKEEFEVLGMPSDRRGERFEESLLLTRKLWTEDWVDGFEGETYQVDGWTSRPHPPRHVPILIGGDSPQQMRRIGELADGWLTHGNYLDTAGEAMQPAREAAERAGRDPDALVIAMTGIALLASDRLEQVVERLGRAREAGVDHAIVGLHPRELLDAPDLMRRFGEDYLAAAKSG
ncbi:MAG: TIGR03619 family F420-dependent LLM class oxidoreductase [Chloroflexi bacterium]|nr:TIGR03619 family F420-dependent LLM class oxidoreductase [Chloroflexota bacterium]